MAKSKAPDLKRSTMAGMKIPQWTVGNEWMTSKLAQWVKALTAKPDDLSLIPGTHMVKDRVSSC